jgi:hypothetical protein
MIMKEAYFCSVNFQVDVTTFVNSIFSLSDARHEGTKIIWKQQKINITFLSKIW